MMKSAIFTALLVLCGSLPRVGGAQRLADSVRTTTARAIRTDSGSGPKVDAGPDERSAKLAPAVAVNAAPKSFTVVRVAVPPAFLNEKAVSYEIAPATQGTVVGKRDGIIDPSKSRDHSLLVTISVPSRMRAGATPLARVRFSSGDEIVEVPIMVSVAASHVVQITAAEGVGAVQSGTTFSLGYRLTNLGNASDTIDLRVVTPTGWRVLDNGVQLRTALPLNATIDRSVRIATPAGSTGPVSLKLIAMSHGSPIASGDATIELLSDQQTTMASGPELTLGSAAAMGPWGSVSSAYAAQLDGQLTDDLRISGRASMLPSRADGSSYAFGRANVYDVPPSLSLQASTWHVGAGVAGATFSELSGVSVAGIGVAAGIDQPRWSGSVLAARPGTGIDHTDGELAGGRFEIKSTWGSANSALTHFDEQGLNTRSLDALSVGGGLTNVFGGQWSGELADRRYRDGEGLGVSSSYSRRGELGNVDVRFSHAPGGAAAFARATNELTTSMSRTIGSRLSMNGSMWRSDDEGSATFQKLSTSGFSVGNRVRLTNAAGITFTGRGSEFDAQSTSGAFGNRQRALEAALDLRVGDFTLLGVASRSALERRTSFDDGVMLMQHAPQASFRGTLRTGGSNGTLALSGSYDETGPGVGVLQRHWEYGAELDRIELLTTPSTRLFASASAQKSGGFATGYAPLTMSLGLALETSVGFTFTGNAEHNPFLISSTGARGWMYVVGVSHGLRLPRLARTETRGVIYKDLNGNGERDPGEPGFAGVVLRRGFEVAVTDSHGEFSFAGQTPDPITVDVRSLPLGWLVPSTTLSPGMRSVGAVGVSSVEIRLTVDPTDSSRISSSDLEKIAVVARDSAGRAWVARRASSSSAVFDALPPGDYALDLDPVDTGEPLRVDGVVPALHVGSGKSVEPQTILIRARSLRFAPSSRLFRRDDNSAPKQADPRAKTGSDLNRSQR